MTSKCPHCGATLHDGAVLCIDCGYHVNRGAVLETERVRPKHKRRRKKVYTALYSSGLHIVVTLGLLIWFTVSELETPGMSGAVAVLVMSLLCSVAGVALALQAGLGAVSRSEQAMAIAALVLALAGCEVANLFFRKWLLVFGLWLLVNILLVVSYFTSPLERVR